MKKIDVNPAEYPDAFRPFLDRAAIYDSSCSAAARVIFIDKDGGYFLKSSAFGTLNNEAVMTKYFHSKGLSANVLAYISNEHEGDWLLTERLRGEDCTAARYLEQPKRLSDTIAELLSALHSTDCADCPIQNRTAQYLNRAERNYLSGSYNKEFFPDNWGYKSAEDAIRVVAEAGRSLISDTLLHGDYCLPNIILNNWRPSGLVDLGGGGVGDRHVDLFWGAWSLSFNLKTDKYRERFFDAYGRDKIDLDMLRIVAACEVFA